jgi:hypothetical protein
MIAASLRVLLSDMARLLTLGETILKSLEVRQRSAGRHLAGVIAWQDARTIAANFSVYSVTTAGCATAKVAINRPAEAGASGAVDGTGSDRKSNTTRRPRSRTKRSGMSFRKQNFLNYGMCRVNG